MQPLLFAIALAWLGIEVLSVSNRGVVALGVMLGVVATPELRGYHVHAEPFAEERYSYQEDPRAEFVP